VTRKAKEWGLRKKENICIYSKTQARSASLSKQSEGGPRIVEILSKLLVSKMES
jgi:hypothetical protein